MAPTLVNCLVHDCQHQAGFTCGKPAIEVSKTGACVSFTLNARRHKK